MTPLARTWSLAGEPCSKYLAVIIADELERFNELETNAELLTGQVREQPQSMSGATMDRCLKPMRDARYPAPCLSSTKPGVMLHSEIPVHRSGTPMEQAPGFFDNETVAHCAFNRTREFLSLVVFAEVLTV